MSERKKKAEHLAAFGWQLSETGDHAGAVGALEEAVRMDPERKEHLNGLGVVLARALRPNEALPYLLKSLKLAPDQIEILCIVGEISVERLDYDTAAKALKRCLELDPKAEHPSGVRARGLIKKAEKQLKKSLGQ